jgi:putative SOS response-associated peptidase YedK
MCGRYKLTTPTGVVVEDFNIRVGRPNLGARYNIAPGQTAPVVRLGHSGRQLATLRWGLIPSWAKDAKMNTASINARAETVHEKPAFRDLVPADGFYEWKTEAGDRKHPYMFARKDGGLMAFAGLWERWEQEGEVVESFTIVVTKANEVVGAIYDRMPVILAPEHFDQWLDTERYPPPDVAPLLTPFSAAAMKAEPVSINLDNVANEGPELLTYEPPLDLFSLR